MKISIPILLLILFNVQLFAQDYWQKINTPDSLQLSDVMVDEQGSIFICSWNTYGKGGVYRSDDNGSSWTIKNSGFLYPPYTSILSLAKDDKNTIYAGGQGWIYKSLDHGESWINVNPAKNYCNNIIVIRCGYDSIILAGGGNMDGIVRSGDNGMTWKTVFDISHDGWYEEVTDIQFGPTGVIYASTRITWANEPGMLYASYDQGRTWQVFCEASYPMALGFDNEGRLLRGEFGLGLYRYDFNTFQWEHILYNGSSPRSILIVPDGKIFLACDYQPNYFGGVMLSTNGGTTFNFINSGFGLSDNATELSVDQLGRVLVLNGWLFRSYDTIFNNLKDITTNDFQLWAYPSPFHTLITFKFPWWDMRDSESKILIFNSTGQLIHQAKVSNRQEYIWDGSNYPAGIYIFKFINSKSTSTIKVLHY